MSDVEQATQVLRWGHTLNCVRYERLRSLHAAAGEQEVLALYTEETYRDSVPAEQLAQLCAMIRQAPPAR